MMFQCVLILFRGPSKAFLAVVASVGIVFGVDGDDMAFKTRSVCGVVLAVLTLIHFFTTVRLHVLFQFLLLPEAFTTAFAPKWQLLSVYRQDVSAQHKRVRNLELAMPALMHLFTPVCSFMLFKLGGPMEALLTDFTLVGIILGVHRDNMPFQVTRVRAFVVTMQALMTFALLMQDDMCLQIFRVCKCLEADLTLKWHFLAVLCLNMGLQIGGVSRFVVTILTNIWLLAGVSAHVLL